MSNKKRAEKIIRHMIDMSYPNHARDIAQELADVGLLAPDLPVPELGWWEIGTRLIRAVTLGRGGKVALMPEGLAFHETHIDVEEARTLAYALLAAANYAEQEQKP